MIEIVGKIIQEGVVGAGFALISGPGASSVRAGAGGGMQMVQLGFGTVKRTFNEWFHHGFAAYHDEVVKAIRHYTKSTVRVTKNMFNRKTLFFEVANIVYNILRER